MVLVHGTSWVSILGRIAHFAPDFSGVFFQNRQTLFLDAWYVWFVFRNCIHGARVVGHFCSTIAPSLVWVAQPTLGGPRIKDRASNVGENIVAAGFCTNHAWHRRVCALQFANHHCGPFVFGLFLRVVGHGHCIGTESFWTFRLLPMQIQNRHGRVSSLRHPNRHGFSDQRRYNPRPQHVSRS